MNSSYLPFRPPKAEAYTLHFSIAEQDVAPPSSLVTRIFKDYTGGGGNVTTNSPTYSTGFGYGTLLLTAEEMDADVVTVQIHDNDNIRTTTIIYTDGTNPGEGFGSGGEATAILDLGMSANAMTIIVEAIAKGFSIVQTDFNNGGFNYIGIKNKPGNWQIIRETTDLQTTTFAANNPKVQTFDNAWTNRTTITYTDQRDI